MIVKLTRARFQITLPGCSLTTFGINWSQTARYTYEDFFFLIKSFQVKKKLFSFNLDLLKLEDPPLVRATPSDGSQFKDMEEGSFCYCFLALASKCMPSVELEPTSGSRILWRAGEASILILGLSFHRLPLFSLDLSLEATLWIPFLYVCADSVYKVCCLENLD